MHTFQTYCRPCCLPAFARALSSPIRTSIPFRPMTSPAYVSSPAAAKKVGDVLSGAKWDYRLLKPINNDTQTAVVFKAEVLQRNGAITPAKWSVSVHRCIGTEN